MRHIALTLLALTLAACGSGLTSPEDPLIGRWRGTDNWLDIGITDVSDTAGAGCVGVTYMNDRGEPIDFQGSSAWVRRSGASVTLASNASGFVWFKGERDGDSVDGQVRVWDGVVDAPWSWSGPITLERISSDPQCQDVLSGR